MVVHTYNPSTEGWRQEDHQFKGNLGYTVKTLSQKNQRLGM
jgi:hypothetical protein